MRKRYYARQPQEIVPDGLRIDVSSSDDVLGFCVPGPAPTELEEKSETEEFSAIRALEDDIVRAWKKWMQKAADRGGVPRGKPHASTALY
ncbi:MAG: hypothetical protein LDL33_14490 [Desulfomonile sp.]|nr:hypothetical protein [Desulfomonile sp.]